MSLSSAAAPPACSAAAAGAAAARAPGGGPRRSAPRRMACTAGVAKLWQVCVPHFCQMFESSVNESTHHDAYNSLNSTALERGETLFDQSNPKR